MKKKQILIVDDEPGSLKAISTALAKDNDYQVMETPDGKGALRLIEEEQIDLVLTDMKLPDIDGMSILKNAKRKNPDTSVLVMTGYGTVESAVLAMKDGAENYLTKPINIKELRLLISNAFAKQQLTIENKELRTQLNIRYGFQNIIGHSPNMQQIYKTILQVAPVNCNVLICGESGTGKELIAKALHYNSPRKNKLFLPINCTALPESLIESELFGYEKGAFTGAINKHSGKFEAADGGTLFLDEIGDMPLSAQARLLRVLEQKEFLRVGGVSSVKVDVRVIAATNKDLLFEVQKMRFREDLYWRLKVVIIQLPPLRERRDDIPLLIDAFIHEFNQTNRRNILGISPKAINALMLHDYPGNIRELKNIIESMAILSQNEMLDLDDLPALIQEPSEKKEEIMIKVGTSMEDAEKKIISRTLKKVNENRTIAANILGIGLRTLHRKIKEYKL
ncbi:sigma-54-dependent Fis family transcriptional regulator [Candidatus Desantisbacteria bacterium]|nr:sigma-54-dependent Fis family transcriptional regulator [Candidatus Desantisbacteria bacterium]